MNYAKGYKRNKDIANEIRSQVEDKKDKKLSGLASRKVNFEGFDQEALDIDDGLFSFLSVDKSFPDLSELPERESKASVEEAVENLAVEDTAKIEPKKSQRPVTPLKGLGGGALEGDYEFEDAIDNLVKKFPGMDKKEIYRVISGESKFDPTVINEYNMAGLFQISPDSAERLGVTTEEIAAMSPAEQVDLYGRYLEMWDYNPDMSLAILQAAPKYRNESDNFVVYKKGSKAWKANPGWRPGDDGDITVGSIKAYYGK
jgi:hypothetical protein